MILLLVFFLPIHVARGRILILYALLTLVEKWRKSLSNMSFGGAILMDLSKAFDTLNHNLLIAKLHACGFQHDALKLLHSYLSE